MVKIEELNDEFVESNILPRLTGKTVGVIRTVSKNLNKILSSDHFIHEHHKKSCLKPSIWLIDEYGRNKDLLYDGIQHLPMPLPSYYDDNWRAVDSVKGFLCFHRPQDSIFTIWNPLLMESKHFKHGYVPYYGLGFGYNANDSDFRIYVVFVNSIDILSLKTGVWRKLSPIDDLVLAEMSTVNFRGIFTGEAVYWGLGLGNNTGVMVLDVNVETLTVLRVPEWLYKGYHVENVNLISDRSLLFFCIHGQQIKFD